MPEICRFMGLVVTMYSNDHPPPHIHVRRGDDEATFLLDGTLHEGSLPRRKRALVRRWARLHQPELAACWDRVSRREPARYDRSTAMRLKRRSRSALVDVTSVEVLHDHVVRLGFSDGCVGELDLGPELWGPLFEPMAASYDEFCRVAVNTEIGTIAWPNGADLAPEVLHLEATGTCAG